jgi:hypothetical protein
MSSKLKNSQEVVQDSIGKYYYSAIIIVKKVTIIMINMATKLINFTEPIVEIVLSRHNKEYFDRFTAFVTLLINHMTLL